MESWLQNNYLKIWSTHNEWKSVVVERLIGTLKNRTTSFSTSLLKNAYIDILANIANVYNNIHDSIVKMKLADVKSSTNARKTIFSFSKCFEKMVFRKNCTGIWSFLYYQERWYLFSPKIWSYSLDAKGKMIFLKKNTWKYDVFFRCSEKIIFPKILTGRWYFL